MTLFVDTSVWSLAFRRDAATTAAEVAVLRQALESGDTIVTTGLILQELLQGWPVTTISSGGNSNCRAPTIDLLTRVGLLLPRMPALGHDRPGGTRKGWAWVSPHTGLQAALQEVRGPR